jgi:hypothetical protein
MCGTIEPAITVSRILRAGYVFEFEGKSNAFDTIFDNPFSRNCHAFPNTRCDEEQMMRAACQPMPGA